MQIGAVVPGINFINCLLTRSIQLGDQSAVDLLCMKSFSPELWIDQTKQTLSCALWLSLLLSSQLHSTPLLHKFSSQQFWSAFDSEHVSDLQRCIMLHCIRAGVITSDAEHASVIELQMRLVNTILSTYSVVVRDAAVTSLGFVLTHSDVGVFWHGLVLTQLVASYLEESIELPQSLFEYCDAILTSELKSNIVSIGAFSGEMKTIIRILIAQFSKATPQQLSKQISAFTKLGQVVLAHWWVLTPTLL